MKIKTNIYFSLVFFLCIFYCFCDKSPTKPEFVYGEVVVGFVDSVSYDFVINYFNSNDLTIKKLHLGHVFKIKADSNDIEYYKKFFSNDTTIKWINQTSVPEEDTLELVIIFNGQNDIEFDRQKIDKVTSLKIIYSYHEMKWALIGCKKGNEKYWVKKLKKLSFIEFAELNLITYDPWE